MSKESIVEKLKNVFVPSLFAGAASAGLYYLLIDHDISTDVPFAGMDVPVWAAVAGSSAIGTMIGEVASEFITPMITKSETLQGLEHTVLPPALAGLGSYLAFRFLVSDQTSITNALIIGAGGSVVGGYVSNTMYGN